MAGSTGGEAGRRAVGGRYERQLKKVEKLEEAMQAKELWTARWEEGDTEWTRTQRKLELREYQRALDNLERLLVARIFELEYTHRSSTGEHSSEYGMYKSNSPGTPSVPTAATHRHQPSGPI